MILVIGVGAIYDSDGNLTGLEQVNEIGLALDASPEKIIAKILSDKK